MSRRQDNVQMYWAHAVAAVLLAIAVAQYVWFGRWEALFPSIAAAVFGFACAVASHEVADWTGRYGWSYDSFWTYPPNGLRSFGLILLGYVDLFGFRLGD